MLRSFVPYFVGYAQRRGVIESKASKEQAAVLALMGNSVEKRSMPEAWEIAGIYRYWSFDLSVFCPNLAIACFDIENPLKGAIGCCCCYCSWLHSLGQTADAASVSISISTNHVTVTTTGATALHYDALQLP